MEDNFRKLRIGFLPDGGGGRLPDGGGRLPDGGGRLPDGGGRLPDLGGRLPDGGGGGGPFCLPLGGGGADPMKKMTGPIQNILINLS